MKTRNFGFRSGGARPNSSILCGICAGGARKFSVFKLRLQYRLFEMVPGFTKIFLLTFSQPLNQRVLLFVMNNSQVSTVVLTAAARIVD